MEIPEIIWLIHKHEPLEVRDYIVANNIRQKYTKETFNDDRLYNTALDLFYCREPAYCILSEDL